MSAIAPFRTLIWFFIIVGVSASVYPATEASTSAGKAAPVLKNIRVVVSTRTLKAHGRSFWHLYLYAGDGRYIRQLTDGKFDDTYPVYAPDGKSIAFTRTPPTYQNDTDVNHRRTFLISLDGSALRQYEGLTTAPVWYMNYLPVKHMEMSFDRLTSSSSDNYKKDQRFTDSENQYEFFNQRSVPENYAWIHNLSTGKKDQVTSMPGFPREYYGQGNLLNFESWIRQGPLIAAAFSIHLGSTLGTAHFLVDLARSEVYQLSPNSAIYFSIDQIPALFVLSEERYRSYGDGDKTANCTYFDIWDSRFHRHRLSSKLSVYRGASLWDPESKMVYNFASMNDY